MPTLYVIHADGEFDPYGVWVSEAWEVVRLDHSECADWNLKILAKADSANTFDALDAYAVVARDVGPVLFVGKLSTRSVGLLETKLATRCVRQQCFDIPDSTAVYEAMLDLIRRHRLGEPEISQRLAVAIMLVAKLERMHYWGGNAKNFMSVSKLAKSNGLDEKYAAIARDVAEYLSADRRVLRLMSHKLGDGSPKYSCNNEERKLVYKFLTDWRIDNDEIMNWLNRDIARVSIRKLDDIAATDYSDQR